MAKPVRPEKKEEKTAALVVTPTGSQSLRPIQPATPVTRPAVVKKIIGVIVAILVLALISLFISSRCDHHGTKTARVEVEFRYDPDLDRWSAVSDTSYWYPTKHAFYHTVEVELRPHEMVGIKTMGKYGFDKFIRRGWRNLDLITAEGFYMKPADLPRSQKPSQYALKSAGLGSLLGAFGEVVYDADHIPHVDGTKNFYVGTECYVVVPDSLLPKLHLTLNERWVRGAWDDNDIGGMMVTITRYKPKA